MSDQSSASLEDLDGMDRSNEEGKKCATGIFSWHYQYKKKQKHETYSFLHYSRILITYLEEI